MAAFKDFKVTRVSSDAWDYTLEITDDAGKTVVLNAGLEDLDVIAFALEVELDAMIDAAERLNGGA